MHEYGVWCSEELIALCKGLNEVLKIGLARVSVGLSEFLVLR